MATRRKPRPGPLAGIVAATDFSPSADVALDRAARLPLAARATLHIVHVLPADLPRKLRGRAELEAQRSLEKAAAMVSAAAHRAGNQQLEIVPVLARGQAHVELIRQARAREADLIAIGRHSRRPLRDLFLGSTAERVVRMSDVPVLVVNVKAAGPYRRPVAAVDLTDMARRVVDLALRLLDPGANQCWLVHAYHVPFAEWMTAEARREWRDKAAKELERLAAGLQPPGVRLQAVLRAGPPEAVLFQEVVRLKSDLVVVGTHGRSGLSHALLGSVAARVLREVPCDVVVARPVRFTFELP